MRAIVLFILPAIIFTSCTKYQCVSIGSDDTPHDEKNEFFLENDSLRLTYGFNNETGEMQVSVFNKTRRRIAIIWARSFVIVHDHPYAFYTPSPGADTGQGIKGYTESAILDTMAVQMEDIEFIQPGSRINRTGISIMRLGLMGNHEFKKEYVRVKGFRIKTRKAKMDWSNSPLQLRVYLTVLSGEDGQSAPIAIQQAFYVAEITKTRARMKDLFPAGQHRNMIMIKEPTTTGKIFNGVGSVLLALAIIAGAFV